MTVRAAAVGARARVSLAAVAREFLRTGTAALLLASVAVAFVLRAAAGPVGWRDAAVLAVLVALRPYAEWAAHRFGLHGRPRRWGRLVLDPLAARAHRAHHADPRDPRNLLTRPRVVAEFVIIVWLATTLLPPRLGSTAMSGILGLGLAAEWTHALVHSAYQPRSRWLRRLARRHRLHHHRNEHYWFGLTSTAADHLLRTAPDPAATPVSPTAHHLPESRHGG
ncbi:MAG: sterol desaturase family protein [Frankia sp.]